MSIVSRYNDYLNVMAFKHSGKTPIGSFNIDEVNPVISTNASVRQHTLTKIKSSVPAHAMDLKYVPLHYLVRDGTPRIFDNEAVESKLANGLEIDYSKVNEPSKEIQELYKRVLYGRGLTAFNGVMINLPAGDMTR